MPLPTALPLYEPVCFAVKNSLVHFEFQALFYESCKLLKISSRPPPLAYYGTRLIDHDARNTKYNIEMKTKLKSNCSKVTTDMNFNVNVVKDHVKTAFVHLKDPWILSWVVSGLLSILIPVITWAVQRGGYYNAYGYAMEQEQYYENNNNNDNNNDNNNNNNNYYSYYEECSWFNWPCLKRQYLFATMDDRENDNGDEDENDGTQQLPDWYLFLGGAQQSEEMMKWKEENTGIRDASSGTSAGVKFVYVWTLFLFIALLAYGAMTLGKKQHTSNLVVFLVLSASFAFMNMITSAQGLISDDEKDVENSYYGWYGQAGVLLTYSNFWIILFSTGYLIAFRVRSYLERKASQKESVEEESEYQNYDAPKV